MISVVIPAYKNTEMLVKNLRHNLKFLQDTEIIIVNDDPSKSIEDAVKEFPVTLSENKQNLGFSGAVNKGFLLATHKYVLLINTDVVLQDNTWKKAVDHLENDTNIFAVSFAQKELDGRTVGKNRIYWEKGFLLHEASKNLKRGPNGWAEGGSCIIRKSYFDELRGFDDIYAPFYWEDIDLSYRAWKAGYASVFDPGIVVEHHHESTIGKYFTKPKVEAIAFRNQFIFIWKNMDRNLLVQHFIRLPLFLFLFLVNKNALRGFSRALLSLPVIMQKRRRQKKSYKHTDAEILSIFTA